MKLSIRAVLIFGIVGIQLITVTVILASSYLTTQDVLLQQARQLMEEVSSQTISHTKQFLERAREAADLTQRLANTDVLRVGSIDNMERYFYEQLQLYPWFSGLYFGADDGSFVFVSRQMPDANGASFLTKIIRMGADGRHVELRRHDGKFALVGRSEDNTDTFDPRTRPWFKKAYEAGRLTWTDPYIFYTSQRPGISATSPVFGVGGKREGAVGVDIEIEGFSSFLRGLKIGETGSALILNGDVIAYPEASLIKREGEKPGEGLRFAKIDELDDPLARAAFAALGEPVNALKLENARFTKFEYDGIVYLAAFTPFEHQTWPWVMGIYVPEDDFLGAIKERTAFNIYLALGISVVACILGFIVLSNTARSMRQLADSANALRAGDFDVVPPAKSAYREVEEVSTAFRDMVLALRERERENLRLRKIQSDLIDSTRDSSLGQFASAVAHELNQPMAAMSNYLQILLRLAGRPDAASADRLRDTVERASAQADRAGAILTSLREIVETGEPNRSGEDLNRIVREAVELARDSAAAQSVVLRTDLQDDLPHVFVSPIQIQQVVLNVIRNGIEAMAECDRRELTVSTAFEEPDMIAVEIRDTGPGLSDEVADRIFSSLVTTKPHGMGVGLSLSKSIIEAHGGQMSAAPGEEGGMVFRFTVPVAFESAGDDL